MKKPKWIDEVLDEFERHVRAHNVRGSKYLEDHKIIISNYKQARKNIEKIFIEQNKLINYYKRNYDTKTKDKKASN